MDKQFSKSIQSMRDDEIELIFSVLPMREISLRMRSALLYRAKTGTCLSSTAIRHNVDRVALSKAESRILTAWKNILEHFERKKVV